MILWYSTDATDDDYVTVVSKILLDATGIKNFFKNANPYCGRKALQGKSAGGKKRRWRLDVNLTTGIATWEKLVMNDTREYLC